MTARLAWWYLKRAARLVYMVPVVVARVTWWVLPEVWREKLCVSVIALSVPEENGFRSARAKLARYLGVHRISPEEYFVLTGALVPFYLGQREERLTKGELSRMLIGRRRFRPDRQGVRYD